MTGQIRSRRGGSYRGFSTEVEAIDGRYRCSRCNGVNDELESKTLDNSDLDEDPPDC